MPDREANTFGNSSLQFTNANTNLLISSTRTNNMISPIPTSDQANPASTGLSLNQSISSILEGLVRIFAQLGQAELTSDQSTTRAKVEDSGPSIGKDASQVDQGSKGHVDQRLCLVAQRLLASGVCKTTNDFDFVSETISNKRSDLSSDEGHSSVSFVKTGVWEVITFQEDSTPKDPFYVVTGVSMQDRVDTRKLRKAILKGMSYSRRPKIHMAPTAIAEDLTGYKSGTMAPICHTTNMKLYLEESILQDSDTTHMFVCGSGLFGKGLSITQEKFLQVAAANPLGFETLPIIQKKAF